MDTIAEVYLRYSFKKGGTWDILYLGTRSW